MFICFQGNRIAVIKQRAHLFQQKLREFVEKERRSVVIVKSFLQSTEVCMCAIMFDMHTCVKLVLNMETEICVGNTEW